MTSTQEKITKLCLYIFQEILVKHGITKKRVIPRKHQRIENQDTLFLTRLVTNCKQDYAIEHADDVLKVLSFAESVLNGNLDIGFFAHIVFDIAGKKLDMEEGLKQLQDNHQEGSIFYNYTQLSSIQLPEKRGTKRPRDRKSSKGRA